MQVFWKQSIPVSLFHSSNLVSLRFRGTTVAVVFGPQALAAFVDHCKPGIMPLPHFSCKMPASPCGWNSSSGWLTSNTYSAARHMLFLWLGTWVWHQFSFHLRDVVSIKTALLGEISGQRTHFRSQFPERWDCTWAGDAAGRPQALLCSMHACVICCRHFSLPFELWPFWRPKLYLCLPPHLSCGGHQTDQYRY